MDGNWIFWIITFSYAGVIRVINGWIKMKPRLGLFVLALFCLPMSAFSSVINVEYSGHISSTSGDGFGYNVGDLIKGTATIDLSKVEGHNFEFSDGIWVYGAASGGLVRTSNYTGDDVGDTINMVRIFDESSTNYDYFDFSEVLSVNGSFSNSFDLGFHFDGLDWIAGTSGDGINLVTEDAALLSQSIGGFARFDMTNWSRVSNASFQLDSAKIVSANLPEPTPFVLLIVGLVGIILRRKLR